MAKKSKIRFVFDSPVTIAVTVLSVIILLLDTLIFKGSLMGTVFICNGSNGLSSTPFDFSNAGDYVSLIFHIFGSKGWMALLINLVVILMQGPSLEERYGSAVFALMIFITSLVSGVLTACLVPGGTTGAASLVFMMIFLSAITAFTKKQIPVSSLLVLIAFFALRLFSTDKIDFVAAQNSSKAEIFFKSNISTFTDLIAGIVGSLFGFLVAPKKARAPKKTASSVSSSNEETRYYSSNSTYNSKPQDDDETVIGSIEL